MDNWVYSKGKEGAAQLTSSSNWNLPFKYLITHFDETFPKLHNHFAVLTEWAIMRLFLWLRTFIMKISCLPGTACRNSWGTADPLPLKDSGSLSFFFKPSGLLTFFFFSESFLRVEWHLSLPAAVITQASGRLFPVNNLLLLRVYIKV